MSKAKRKGQRLAIGLGALQVFIGIGGVAGGVGLVSEPSGANLGLAVELATRPSQTSSSRGSSSLRSTVLVVCLVAWHHSSSIDMQVGSPLH